MDKKDRPKSFVSQLAKFIMGWGFYIVLFLCVAVVGVSAWSLIATGKKTMDDLEASASAVITSAGSSYRAEDFTIEPPELSEPVSPEPEVAPPEEISQPASDTETQPAEPAAAIVPEPEPLYFIWPLSGEVELPYAVESLVYDKTMADWRSHSGLDIAAPLGTKVSAAAKGTVESIYADPLYGTTVIIDHGQGVKSVYCNLAATPAVAEGDSVSVGDTLGAVGETALVEIGDVNHLHFEMRADGAAVDPMDYLPER